MTGAAHAGMGAALGALIRKPALAFTAGILSHVLADAVPHRDLKARYEIPMAVGALAVVAARHGARSAQFWGALGAVVPDLEHGLVELGLRHSRQELFHGRFSFGERLASALEGRISQPLLFAACLLVAETTGTTRSGSVQSLCDSCVFRSGDGTK